MVLRDYLVNQLILESGKGEYDHIGALAPNEFDVPATLVPEREVELQSLLFFVRERLELVKLPDLSSRIEKVEGNFFTLFPLVRPHTACRVAEVSDPADLEEGLEGHCFRVRPAAGPHPRSHDQRNHGRSQRSDLRGTGRRAGALGTPVHFRQGHESIIERIVAQVGRRIDKSQPLVDARLPDGSRVNAVIPPLAIRGPCLTIRKFPLRRLTMDDLVELGSITRAAAMFLRACVIDRKNVLVSGGTGTGKPRSSTCCRASSR